MPERKPALNTFGVFAKYWQPGKVKTRLGQSIGFEKSCEIHRLFAEYILERFSGVADDQVIAIWPAGFEQEFIDRRQGAWRVSCQAEGDLGARMDRFFKQQFRRGASKVVLIGSDCPHLEVSRISSAFAALDQSDVVLGPASDGGYYLIGMSRIQETVFQGIDWSTPDVLAQTQQKLDSRRIVCSLLEEEFDIDTEVDLQRFLCCNEPDSTPSIRPSLASLQDSVNRILRTDVRHPLNVSPARHERHEN